jgi:hypothetical protein
LLHWALPSFSFAKSEETLQNYLLITHEDDGHFVVNMHALHNASILWKVLPCELTAPKPLYTDWKAHHYKIAAGL